MDLESYLYAHIYFTHTHAAAFLLQHGLITHSLQFLFSVLADMGMHSHAHNR